MADEPSIVNGANTIERYDKVRVECSRRVSNETCRKKFNDFLTKLNDNHDNDGSLTV